MPNVTDMSTDYMTAEEAAERLKHSKRWLLDRARSNPAIGSKVGHKWLFTEADLEALVDTGRSAPLPTGPVGSARQRRQRRLAS